MTEIADTFQKLSADFSSRVAGVQDWSSQSPCEEWTAADVVKHVTGNAVFVAGAAGFTPTEGLDPTAAWTEANEAMQAALADPEKAAMPLTSPFGPSTVEGFTGQIFTFDLLVHTWDLARATGQDETLDAGAVSAIFAAVAPMDEMLRSPHVCGPKLDAPENADEQTRFLAFLGRKA